MDDNKFGYIKLNLEELIASKGISKNKICQRAEMQRTQLNTYCRGEVQRVDLGILSRLCLVLDCKVEDILVYLKPEKKE